MTYFMLPPILTKRELLREMRLFIKDKERGISVKLFADLCGVDHIHLLDVFLYQSVPLTERMQRRVSKGYDSWKKGEVAIMQNRDRSKFVTYRKEEKPRLVPTTALQVVNGQIKIKVGMSNKSDYSGLTLDETIGRG